MDLSTIKPLYVYRALFPKRMIPLIQRHGVCKECGWTGHFNSTKHRSQIQLEARNVMNSNGIIIDAYILNVKRRNGGWVDLAWCPICDTFIEIYYDYRKNQEPHSKSY